jgi:hypothetical protein
VCNLKHRSLTGSCRRRRCLEPPHDRHKRFTTLKKKRKKKRRIIVGVKLSNLSHLPIRRKTFAPQRDPPGRPFCSDLQRDLFVSGENFSNTVAAATKRNRPQNQQKHYRDDPPIIMRNTGPSLCASAALRHLCAFSWRWNKTSRRHRFCETKKMAVLERGSGRCFFFHSGHHRFANPAFVALLLYWWDREEDTYIIISCAESLELISFSVQEIAFLSHAWR